MKIKIVRIAVFFAVCVIIPLLIFILPKEEVSYDENRTFADMPKFTFSSYLNENFMTDFESFLSDRFVLRKQFIKLKNSADKIMGKNEVDSVLKIDGKLIQTFRRNDDALSVGNNSAVNRFAEGYNNVYFVLVPTAQELYKKTLPLYLNLSDQGEFIRDCYSQTQNCKSIDLSNSISNSNSEYLYYRTDHHWTSENALISYNEIAKKMNLTHYEKSDFNVEKATDSFQGTLYSKTFDDKVKKDEIFYYKNKNSENVITKKNGEIHKGIFYTEYLSQKDKYASFLGENTGFLKVLNSNKKGKLLLIKDSYANTLMQFLSLEYGEITVVDLRYAKISELKSINRDNYESILILYNALSYYTDSNVTKLMYIG